MHEKMDGGMKRKRLSWPGLFALLLSALGIGSGWAQTPAPAPTGAAAKEPAYKVEYYYKTQWGHADEWLALFKKNHLPLLKALKEEGRILDIAIDRPRYHQTEDGRWDYRVTVTWKSYAASNDPGNEQALIRKLFPDQETFKREEQRRFEILISHSDVPIVSVPLEP